MSLTNTLYRFFTFSLQQQGRQFQPRVQIETATDVAVEATMVHHKVEVCVILVRDESRLWGECNCLDFAQFNVCGHVWAAILAAEQRGALTGSEPAREFVRWDPAKQGRPLTPGVARELARNAQLYKWKKHLGELSAHRVAPANRRDEWPPSRQMFYVVETVGSPTEGGIQLDLYCQDLKKNGEWGNFKPVYVTRSILPHISDPDDRHVIAFLLGAESGSSTYSYDQSQSGFRLHDAQMETLLPQLCRLRRCFLQADASSSERDAQLPDRPDWVHLDWDADDPWQFQVVVDAEPDVADEPCYRVRGWLIRGAERMPISDIPVFAENGIFFSGNRVMRCAIGGGFGWVKVLHNHPDMLVPRQLGGEFLSTVLNQPFLPALELPEELRFERVRFAPRPHLRIKPPDPHAWSRKDQDRLRGNLFFVYGDETIPDTTLGSGVYHAETRTFRERDRDAENAAEALLRQLGWQPGTTSWVLAQNKLPRVVRELIGAGWGVEAEGKVYRPAGAIKIEVSSGIDWFDLHGTVDFDGVSASLPVLLAALKRGESVVALGDGTFGLLPEEWLHKYGLLAGIGQTEGESLRFKRTQVGVLDALLASQPDARFDETFLRAREALKRFTGIEAAEQPAGFVGELRGYQKEGLGWIEFLQRFGFGGCLADDMGVGKTPQVLAMLELRRHEREAALSRTSKPGNGKARAKKNGAATAETPAPPPPSLVVVPKSLVFNWKQEAARFTPQLRLLDHTGQLRQKGQTDHFKEYDVVLTTYGTLRNDAVDFKDVEFDYVVLDEAQAIKNADTASAKAARLLNGRHRLALSGTPIENHLGELWSLFEFLNPGMLGAASVFHLSGSGLRNPDGETRKLLAQALRPFILRRTKAQVATELPEKLEQTLYCELEPAQRKLYNELRDHYRNTLLDRIAREGIGKAKIQVLEALLRLRQAAIHPGLIDPTRAKNNSAKLDLLLDQLEEVCAGGHKALVFSQFTKMLAIVRDRLDKAGVVHEYLDGQTTDRQARVERFQSDPDCPLFLISLKAGGVGLNLTAAEYVFLLDPWWNPAVEMQAIDRAHRIGQQRQVFAYRLIARDTVEEKVLQLQSTKRNLADAIISEDNSLIRDLGREDLELLLS
jgi:superfamily II DNA or RNA helicase